MIPEFFTPQRGWPARIEQIVELVGRVSALEQVAADRLELRRTNRIWAVHSSTAIEGNQLSVAQVAGVADGALVLAPPRDVKEVENALAAYDALDTLDRWSVDDFLRAHRLLSDVPEPEIDAAPFIGYMLDTIKRALIAYEARARSSATSGGVDVGALKADGLLQRAGPDKTGHWAVVEKGRL